MKRTICLAFWIVYATLLAHAQTASKNGAYADSLLLITQGRGTDSTKAAAHLLLTYSLVFRDPAEAAKHLEQGRRLGVKYPLLVALTSYYEGILLYASSDPVKSEASFLKADSLLGMIHTKEAVSFRSKSWRNIGILRQVSGDEAGFADILVHKAIPLAQQAGDSLAVGKNYLDLSLVFKNTMQYGKATGYILQSINVFRQQRSLGDLVVAYNTGAENYVLDKKYPEAKTMLDSSWKLLSDGSYKEFLIDYYTAESMYYDETKDFKKSLASIDKGIALSKQYNKRYEEQRLLLQKYYTHYNQNDYTNAREVLRYLAEQPEMMSQISNRLQVYNGLAETNARLGSLPAAYNWLKQYSQLSDSVSEVKLTDNIHALEIKFNTAEKQKEIAALKMERERAALSAKNNRLINWLLGTASSFLLVLAVFSYLFYRNNKKLSEQQQLNHHQQLKEIEQQQQIRFSQAMLQGEERERRRVAGDLHDGLGGMLAGVKMNLTELSSTPASGGAELHKVIGQLDSSISELRRIARNMMPEALLKFGLDIALKDLCGSMMTESVRINYQSLNIEDNIPQATQVTIYRIVQELLSNAIRHAQAGSILLQCSQNGDTFLVTIEDNGKGFDTAQLGQAKGIGLSNVKRRVDYLHGNMEIISAENEGTTINIELNVGE
ncbi:ATP-binding protein [Chitinophaga sp. GCM10012297]|uniref:histidine kinase n=1 Tax=Chitinophaga chungangae TaxID=2821488 RepID=A0ABS3YAL8_9BACT|nr:sensor histidine kinase [Chitinophaga chungangae]MBO9151731.1 sensor histidine kinase [Chitinophaga chungangae]